MRCGEIHMSCGEICALLGYWAACSCNSLPTYQDNLSVPSLRIKKFKVSSRISWPLKMGQIWFPEMSIRNYHYTLR